MNSFDIAVLPGDGIGPEVISEAIKVLHGAQGLMPDVEFRLQEFSVGAQEYLSSGDPLPASSFEACVAADAVLLGAMGLPDVRWPDGKEMTPQLDLRERLDLFCGLRPIYLFHPNDCPLKGHAAGGIDILIVRESTEGLFSARGSSFEPGADVARDVLTISRRGTERVSRAAFHEANRRRKKLTLVDKANVLPSMAFFRQVFDGVAREFPDIATERVYVDAAALYLIQRPGSFDVIVTENMFGDILSDLAAGLVGGMGMAPSADIGPDHAVFQPSHGSAPDIAGRGVANPVAAILSMAMMLEWLSHSQTVAAAERIKAAVKEVLGDPTIRTPDLGGSLSTSQVGEAIMAKVGMSLSDRRN